jgi:hypothetical protein
MPLPTPIFIPIKPVVNFSNQNMLHVQNVGKKPCLTHKYLKS